MAKIFADFRPSISRKSGRKKFHKELATNSAGREIKSFHRETLGAWGHKKHSARQGYCYTCLAIGGGYFGRVTKKNSDFPCPSFLFFGGLYQRKTQNYQGFSVPTKEVRKKKRNKERKNRVDTPMI